MSMDHVNPPRPLNYEARDAFGHKKHESLGGGPHHGRFLRQWPRGFRIPKFPKPKRHALPRLTAEEWAGLTYSERLEARIGLKHRTGWRGRA